MAYDIFSTRAQTGESATTVVSTNPYSNQGRTIGFPNNLDLYTRQISDSDGSQSIVERRKLSDLIGSKLYLYHRPLISSNGTITTITVSDGVVDTSSTNSSQAYIVFSTLPSGDFTVSYSAAPDCDFSWVINTLKDSVMEIEGFIGPRNDLAYPGLRSATVATFDNPTDAQVSGVLPNAVTLSHLDRDITIASSDDAGLQVLRGTVHTIQVGRKTDLVIVDTTGFVITQSDGTLKTKIVLGSKTGDTINWKGTASGAGPLIVGGAEWASMYSGVKFSIPMTGSYYSGALLRVHGDSAFMGDVKAYGNITVINATGSTSTIMGDFTVQDELFVNGRSHLAGTVDVNDLVAALNITAEKDIIAGNVQGSGGGGQTLVDNLDCSEVALSYKYVTKSKHNNSVISAPLYTGLVAPKKNITRPWMTLDGNYTVGDIFSITGQLNAAASSSGAHPHILQLLLNVPIVSGTNTSTHGYHSGVWSKGMMQPGSMWIRMLDGPSQNLNSPIYGYNVEETGTVNTLTRLNVFLPDAVSSPPQTSNKYILYNPHSAQYNTITAAGGASPTFTINASTSEPVALSFEDGIRLITVTTTTYSMQTALEYSVSGWATTPRTGVAYIFADSNNTDPENIPIFKAKAVPMRMPGQTPVGEVVASTDGSTWTVLETISYRPNGHYDSAWIPIFNSNTAMATSGRCTPGLSTASTHNLKIYFNHYLGSDVDIGNISADLYLGAFHPGTIAFNQTNTPMYSFFGQDARVAIGLSGSMMHVPLGAKRTTSAITDKDASIFYLDSAIIGVDISPNLLVGSPITGSTLNRTAEYLRLIVNKQN